MDTKTATGDTVAPPTVDVVPMLQPERAGRGSRTDCTHFGSPRWGLLGQPRLTPGHFANRTPVRLTKVTRNCRQHLSLDDLTDLQLYARVAGTGQHQSLLNSDLGCALTAVSAAAYTASLSLSPSSA